MRQNTCFFNERVPNVKTVLEQKIKLTPEFASLIKWWLIKAFHWKVACIKYTEIKTMALGSFSRVTVIIAQFPD